MSTDDNAPANTKSSPPPPRRYTVRDARDLVALLANSGDYSEAETAGMQKLVEILAHYEFMSEADIDAEVAHHFAAKKTV